MYYKYKGNTTIKRQKNDRKQSMPKHSFMGGGMKIGVIGGNGVAATNRL